MHNEVSPSRRGSILMDGSSFGLKVMEVEEERKKRTR
jgi:hypothetical protein